MNWVRRPKPKHSSDVSTRRATLRPWTMPNTYTSQMSQQSKERESLFTITKHKHNSKPILHKLGGLQEGHTPITAGYPLLMSTKHSNVQWEKKCWKILFQKTEKEKHNSVQCSLKHNWLLQKLSHNSTKHICREHHEKNTYWQLSRLYN